MTVTINRSVEGRGYTCDVYAGQTLTVEYVSVEQGMVEAGNERPVSISWTPPAGHEV